MNGLLDCPSCRLNIVVSSNGDSCTKVACPHCGAVYELRIAEVRAPKKRERLNRPGAVVRAAS